MMNLNDLIGAAPELLSGLKELGLDEGQVDALSGEVGRQLLGGSGPDLGGLLTGLDVAGFLERIDVQELAARVGIDTGIAQAALQRIAPAVESFSGEGLTGRLGSLASGLFRRD